MTQKLIPKTGDFPFPSLLPGRHESESAFVSWIRNHSSYLTVGTFTSQLGRVANFLGGTLWNSVIFAPWILLLSLLLGISHFALLAHPIIAFLLISATAMIAIVWLLKPSSVQVNGKIEKPRRSIFSFHLGGCLLLASVIAAVIVSVPVVVEYARDQFRFADFGWYTIVWGFGLVLLCLTIVHRAIPTSSGFRRMATMGLFLCLGVFGLLSLTLLLESFVVYGNPLRLIPTLAPFELIPEPILYVTLVIIAACIVFAKARHANWPLSWQTFSYPAVVVPACFLLCFAFAVHRPILDSSIDPHGLLSDDGAVMELRRSIGRLALPLSEIAAVDAPEGLSLDIQQILHTLALQRKTLNAFYERQPHGLEKRPFSQQHLSPWAIEYFDMAQLFADNGGELSDADPLILEELRHGIAMEYRRALFDFVLGRQPASLSSTTAIERVRVMCSTEILKLRVRHHVRSDVRRRFNRLTGQTSLSLNSVTSQESIERILQQLESSGPNAAHQHEMVEFVGRSDELPELGIAHDGTIATQGDISFLAKNKNPESSHLLTRAQAEEIISGTCARDYLSAIDANRFAVLDRRHREGEFSSYSDAFLDERVLRLLRTCPPELIATVAMCEIRERSGRSLTEAELGNPWWHRYTRARESVGNDYKRLAKLARQLLCENAIYGEGEARKDALDALGTFARPPVTRRESSEEQLSLYSQRTANNFDDEEIIHVAMAKFGVDLNDADSVTAADDAVLVMATGPIGAFNQLHTIRPSMMMNSLPIKIRMFAIGIIVTLVIGFLVDVNANSMHGFYRDQLARAFFLRSSGGKLQNDADIRMSALSQPGSVAPYLIINAAMNLQASTDLGLRDRRSDFFVFTKYFCGSERTSYACTRHFESIYRQFRLSTAMAVSAAAASPNMGRNTNGLAVAIMTLLNVRLGYWFPNPRLTNSAHIEFHTVFRNELEEQIWSRWYALYDVSSERRVRVGRYRPSTDHALVGLAFSGGGIRSAALNLGIAQALDQGGVFRHVDYLSTVSGGGYTGSSIAVAMRKHSDRTEPTSPTSIQRADTIMAPVSALFPGRADRRTVVADEPGFAVQKRLPPANFGWELISRLNEDGQWVNLSDGGHIENLATIELLRRRCKFIIVGDGEADPKHNFNGFGTLMRLAALELGVKIAIDLSPLRLREGETVRSHFVFGRIEYPETEFAARETGVLLYLKSSLTGDEDERINEYKGRSNSFPHESTADQFFDLGQFDAYRELGLHVAWKALQSLAHEDGKVEVDLSRFSDFQRVFQRRLSRVQARS